MTYMTILRWVILFNLLTANAYALTSFYVDPDFSGSPRNGSAGAPWQSLDESGAWANINAALSIDDVTVYFSAREAFADVPEETATPISIMRTDAGIHRLILDGKSRYNSDDVNPSAATWAIYADGVNPGHTRDGGNAHQITTSGSNIYSSGIATAKQNYVTIQGFITVNTGGGKCAAYWAGDHVRISDIRCSQTATASGGPNFYYQCILNDGDTTCPGDRDGGASCFPSTDIEWSYLKVDGGYGEALYHCGCYTQTDSACMTGHSDVWIHHNIFKDASLRSGQGDGIEVKPAVSFVTIEDNTIYWQDQDPVGTIYTMAYGIIINASAIVQRNFIYNYPGDGINLNENADNAVGYRNASQTRIVNNVIVDVGQRSAGTWRHGIHANHESGDDDWYNVLIANNTIFGAGLSGIRLEHQTASLFDVRNNIISRCGDIELHFLGDSASDHDFNLLYDTSGTIYNYNGAAVVFDGHILPHEPHSLNNEDPVFLDETPPYDADNFALQAASRAIGRGDDLSAYFTDDYNEGTRTSWDMGAHAFSATGSGPSDPPSDGDGSGGGCFIGVSDS